MQPEREWVGLRPGRRSVRLEYEEAEVDPEGSSTDTLRVVHNYGKSCTVTFVVPYVAWTVQCTLSCAALLGPCDCGAHAHALQFSTSAACPSCGALWGTCWYI